MMPDDKLILTEAFVSRSDAVKNRALLLETAQRLFTQQGVNDVTMSAIAEAAGVGKGTLYRHFENKLELTLALLDEDQRLLQMRTLEYLRQSDDDRESLKWFVNEVLGFVDRNSQLLCVNAKTTGSLEVQAHWWWRQTLYGLLNKISPENNNAFAADALYVLLDVHNIYFLRTTRGYGVEDIRQNLLDMINRLV
ncbi:MAG: helix-turn-helix transcriptional regulator [Anaerolineae bacterium]|nr:helix-turn-helix transcriptional regulator [Anaerolineae bacterium]